MTNHRYAGTTAAKMLAAGLRSAAQEHDLSLREIGRRLGYRQPVVLSHMANGRVPIPIDRAAEIARQVGISPDRFLEVVLRQHHPEVEWGLITGKPDLLLSDLQEAVGKPLNELSAGHRRVLKEVVQDSKPDERWLSIPEIAAVKYLRQLFPKMSESGLSEGDRETLRLAVDIGHAEDVTHNPQRSTKRNKTNES